ncbi:MAG: hypothetical protein ACI8SR_000419 [Oceanicoccus sp.]|jgi:hypothetical protein
MDLRIALISSLLISSTAYSAVDNNIVKSKEASHITLAGRIGEAAMFSVQADDDDRAEIFTTASSQIDQANDHWLLLDWDGADYKVIRSGELQAKDQQYLSSYQVSFQEIIVGHKNGLVSKIAFTDDTEASEHILTEDQFLLSSLTNQLDEGIDADQNIKSIVNLQGTDLNNYLVLCTEDYLHILNNDQLESSLAVGGYCQTGNIDYEKLVIDNTKYDQELITAAGQYFNYNGTSFIEKTGLSTANFGDNFKVANIDDDDAAEILSQTPGQLQSFAPASTGSWVYISSLQRSTTKFNTVDINNDGISEIIFDYIYTTEQPHAANISLVSWDTSSDTHKQIFASAPHLNLSTAHLVATDLTAGTPQNFVLFVSNDKTANPTAKLLSQLNPNTLVSQWSGLTSTASRGFEGIAKSQVSNNIADYKITQIEQVTLGENLYEYAVKYLNSNTLSFDSALVPDFLDDEIVSVNSFEIFDFNADGIDELHFGGAANYTDTKGVVLSSKQDGSDYARIETPYIESVTALFVGNVNNANTTDMIATGKYTEETAISVYPVIDSVPSGSFWFAPGSGDTSFKKLISANIKGTDDFEVLGLHSQLASIDLSASILDSKIYNLSNLDLDQFSPITLADRPYEYALASDAAGMLHFIEPKDFDILATVKACDTELSAIHSVEINNNTHVAFSICGQTLQSWVLEYSTANIDFGYSLYPLANTDLGNADTSNSKLISITTSDDNTHLFTLLKNQFSRLTLNKGLSDDTDTDGKVNYRDVFPDDKTQWEDNDQDSLGDNQTGNNPDPSLNDIDNDGVLDGDDPDNNPENDFDPSNDSDNGSPIFTSTFDTVNTSSTDVLTTISLAAPSATDVFDDHNGTDIFISASTNGTPLNMNADKYEIDLASGRHSILWKASDNAGNITSANQIVNLYPSIAFTQSTSTIGEEQSSTIELTLSGESPVYPFDVEITVTAHSANNSDVSEDITTNLTVRFENDETTKTLTLSALDDDIAESDETLTLSIADTFEVNTWTINPVKNTHILTIVDVNEAPVVRIESEQNGAKTTSPDHISGIITLSSNVTDANNKDAHTYLWDLSSLGLGSSLLNTVAINPEVITPGVYTIRLTVTDNGLPAKSTMTTFTLNYIYGDSDDDGVADNLDKFPTNPKEWADNDGDGFGDEEEDRFPEDATEHADDDNDGTGNNADPFDNDPTETKDSDNDGVGDKKDAFPTNFNEQVDSDGDGVGDNSDIFPNDANEQYDADGDGVGDNTDAFPQDPKETKDSDGDRVGDNSDLFPLDPKRSKEVKEETKKEDEGFGSSGSLHLFWLLMLLPVVVTRRKAL